MRSVEPPAAVPQLPTAHPQHRPARRLRNSAVVGAVIISAVAMTGCTQIASLKQVSGVPITTLTIAANDILVDQKVPVLQAPVCALANAVYTCNGTTTTKKPIVVTAPDTENLVMVIKVDNAVIFTGSVQEVIEKAQQGVAP